MIAISVVRNVDLYNKLVRDNKFLLGSNLVLLDNRDVNMSIPCRYNAFLDSYDYTKENWFVFCHEDWELKEDLSLRLNSLSKDYLYGPIGCVRDEDIAYASFPVLGRIWESEKDGSDIKETGVYTTENDIVGTFDCQCLIVHSSLVKKYNLRFDESLTFDLYVEDFCINALHQHMIVSRVLQIECQHYSRGNVLPRFYKQHKYLRKKYKRMQHVFFTTCSQKFIGSNSLKRLIYTFMFRYVRYSTRKNGTTRIKIFKFPLPIIASNFVDRTFRKLVRLK